MVSVSAKAQSRFGVADVANARTINLVSGTGEARADARTIIWGLRCV
jgi:hypothetical protein